MQTILLHTAHPGGSEAEGKLKGFGIGMFGTVLYYLDLFSMLWMSSCDFNCCNRVRSSAGQGEEGQTLWSSLKN